MSRLWVIGSSVVVHGLVLVGLGEIRTPESHAATAIEVFESRPKPPPPPPPIAEIEPEKKAPRKEPRRAQAAAPEPETAPTPTDNLLGALPEFGLELSGGNGPGLALPSSTGPRGPVPSGPVTRNLTRAAEPKKSLDACEEPPAKPKLLSLPQPGYTEAARALGIEGKVRVQLTVNDRGEVTDARVLVGLGHGLDEAALAAARAARFEPALRCGKVSSSTFTIAMRFSAS